MNEPKRSLQHTKRVGYELLPREIEVDEVVGDEDLLAESIFAIGSFHEFQDEPVGNHGLAGFVDGSRCRSCSYGTVDIGHLTLSIEIDRSLIRGIVIGRIGICFGKTARRFFHIKDMGQSYPWNELLVHLLFLLVFHLFPDTHFVLVSQDHKSMITDRFCSGEPNGDVFGFDIRILNVLGIGQSSILLILETVLPKGEPIIIPFKIATCKNSLTSVLGLLVEVFSLGTDRIEEESEIDPFVDVLGMKNFQQRLTFWLVGKPLAIA